MTLHVEIKTGKTGRAYNDKYDSHSSMVERLLNKKNVVGSIPTGTHCEFKLARFMGQGSKAQLERKAVRGKEARTKPNARMGKGNVLEQVMFPRSSPGTFQASRVGVSPASTFTELYRPGPSCPHACGQGSITRLRLGKGRYPHCGGGGEMMGEYDQVVDDKSWNLDDTQAVKEIEPNSVPLLRARKEVHDLRDNARKQKQVAVDQAVRIRGLRAELDSEDREHRILVETICRMTEALADHELIHGDVVSVGDVIEMGRHGLDRIGVEL